MKSEIHTIVDLYREKGCLRYDGEGVCQLEHAWQCGILAKKSGASPKIQLAAWLHDIGHLLSTKNGSPTTYNHDDRHEHAGGKFLSKFFSDEVYQPVLLHVLAKRYLVSIKPDYLQTLSQDSIRSLQLQGGQMSNAECESFIKLPFAKEAIALREWDDLGKDPQKSSLDPMIVIKQLYNLIEACR